MSRSRLLARILNPPPEEMVVTFMGTPLEDFTIEELRAIIHHLAAQQRAQWAENARRHEVFRSLRR